MTVVAYYMDQNVSQAITLGLRLRGIDVLTAFEDGHAETPDPDLLDRAGNLRRMLFTRDVDFVVEANRRLEMKIPFFSIVYARQSRVSIGQCVENLELIAKIADRDDVMNNIYRLPL